MRRLLVIVVFMSNAVLMLHAQSDENATAKRPDVSILQSINVTIGGDFIVTGSFTASRLQRVDHFITSLYLQVQQKATGSVTTTENIKLISKELNRFALRGIVLKRANGEVLKLDLLKFRITGDFANNPYLQNDDVIIFPSFDTEKNIIDISGAVNKPTKFQFVGGDKLSDAILFAGGINPIYDSASSAEISRLDNTGTKEEIIRVSLSDNTDLRCGDRIKIIAAENERKNYSVNVLGEVRQPGLVYVAKDGSPLIDVIKKAGGFTPNADLRHAEIIRDLDAGEILRKSQIEHDFLESTDSIKGSGNHWRLYQEEKQLKIVRLNTLDKEDSLIFGVDNNLRMLQSECLVDFTKLDDPKSDESTFMVKEGDFIIVPQKFDYIYVFGQVEKAGYLKYEPGKDYSYYIEKAGGLTEIARSEGSAIIIKGKEMNWVTKHKNDVTLEPGDYIYVPKNVPLSFWGYVQRIGTVLAIVGNVATIVLLLIQFKK